MFKKQFVLVAALGLIGGQLQANDLLWADLSVQDRRLCAFQGLPHGLVVQKNLWVESFVDTNWSRSEEKVFGDFLDNGVFDYFADLQKKYISNSASITEPAAILFGEFLANTNISAITELLKKISTNRVGLISLLHFNGSFFGWRFGGTLPILSAQVSHLWVDKKTEAEMSNVFAGLPAVGDRVFSPDQANELAEVAREIIKDIGIGDLRVFGQTDIELSPTWKVDFGIEALIAMNLSRSPIPEALRQDRPKQFSLQSLQELASGVGGIQDPSRVENLFYLLRNIYQSLHVSKLLSRADMGRSGCGLFVSSKYKVRSLCTIFAFTRGTHLFSRRGVAVLPVDGEMSSLETSAVEVNYLPVFVVHSSTGACFDVFKTGLRLVVGVDSYFKTTELVEGIKSALGSASQIMWGQPMWRYAELEQFSQHRGFASLLYDSSFYSVNLSGHYTVRSTSKFDRDWGFGLGVGFAL